MPLYEALWLTPATSPWALTSAPTLRTPRSMPTQASWDVAWRMVQVRSMMVVFTVLFTTPPAV